LYSAVKSKDTEWVSFSNGSLSPQKIHHSFKSVIFTTFIRKVYTLFVRSILCSQTYNSTGIHYPTTRSTWFSYTYFHVSTRAGFQNADSACELFLQDSHFSKSPTNLFNDPPINYAGPQLFRKTATLPKWFRVYETTCTSRAGIVECSSRKWGGL